MSSKSEKSSTFSRSCGDWSSKIEAVKGISDLCMVDGAFSAFTDPQPNAPEPFGESFVNTVMDRREC